MKLKNKECKIDLNNFDVVSLNESECLEIVGGGIIIGVGISVVAIVGGIYCLYKGRKNQ